VGCVVQLLVQWPSLRAQRLWVRPRLEMSPVVRNFWWQMVPGLFALGVYQVNIIVLRTLSSHLPEGSVTHLYLADRLLELVNGVFAIAIAQGAFSAMTTHAQQGNHSELIKVWRFSFLLQNMVAIPAAVGLWVVAEPIVSVLFLHGRFDAGDVQETARCVRFAAAGLIAASTVRGSVQMFYALDDRRTPLWVSLVVVVLNAVLGVLLMRSGLGVASLSATLTITYFVQAGLLLWRLRARLGPLGASVIVRQAVIELLLGLAAGAAAYAVCLAGTFADGTTPRNLIVLGVAIAVAAGIYGAGAVLLKLAGTETLLTRVRSRLRRRPPPR
jgi:putative peptidoglycan lipid II flippase